MNIAGQNWHKEVEVVPSPNFNERPNSNDISLLVIHNISLPPGKFGGGYIKQFFQNKLDATIDPFFDEIKDLQVSAHFLIERSGHVVQFVPTGCRAWHAGVSIFEGRENCNDFSIGIELEGTDIDPYSDDQYNALATLTKQLRDLYPKIELDRIVGHSDIAPERKTDPGPVFDWQRYRKLLD
ncbi:1,6-anhydro-N-acetylmuramyl-L-alanine amidase AmpD [Neptuniibacter sp. SY11_33]|uniref:1,6-anhydro-N-acetylmuramyl-L-alanine amidase AmpD n=1 Tax=Neptuniibacter sp. SY11_33 TaxID=3398215 RepID=UPI0039F52042